VVVKYNYSMEGQRSYLLDYVGRERRVGFETLFTRCENRIHAIFTFLSMLELIQMNFMSILIGTGRNNFIVEWNEEQQRNITDQPDTEIPPILAQ
jgi:segregation and condensation protein A